MTIMGTYEANWPNKYADEKFPNAINWKNVLARGGDTTIDSCSAEVVEGTCTIDDPVPATFSGTNQTVWVSGGVVGTVAILCRVNTANGRTYEQKMRFTIEPD
jgi:hypothetical protein